jgi:hypothetical protein
VIARDGGENWKPTYARRMTLLTSICIITHEVRANGSGNYVHRENR